MISKYKRAFFKKDSEFSLLLGLSGNFKTNWGRY